MKTKCTFLFYETRYLFFWGKYLLKENKLANKLYKFVIYHFESKELTGLFY